MKYRTILADPPWRYERFSYKNHGAAASHYAGMTCAELCRLPVPPICEPDAALLLWTTFPKLNEVFPIIEAWGFRYVSGFPWLKMTAQGTPRFGIGWHTRSCAELLLIGVRGKGMVPAIADRRVGVLFNPIGRHSAKPESQYEIAEAYGTPALEMFARPDGGLFPTRDGWTRIGNEITGRDIDDDLRRLAGDSGTD